MGLVLDLCYYRSGLWSAEVSEQQSGDCVAIATGATADEARDAVLAQLTPEQLADLTTSLAADLAAVARQAGYRCEPSGGRVLAYKATDPICDASVYTIQYTRYQLFGLALAIDTLRREQEATDD